MPEDKKLALPGSSWDTVKKIVRAYLAASNVDSLSVRAIARLAGVHRPVVSMNNNFLRSVGIVRLDDWKLTEIGTRYATGLEMGNDSMASESLAEAALGNPVISQLIGIVRARGELKVETFKGETLIRLGIAAQSRQAQFVKPLLDMLQEAKLIKVSDDLITFAKSGERGSETPKEKRYETPPANEQNSGSPNRQPLLLGPNRLAYIELPSDWDAKDLPKLLKLLQLSLGGDVKD